MFKCLNREKKLKRGLLTLTKVPPRPRSSVYLGYSEWTPTRAMPASSPPALPSRPGGPFMAAGIESVDTGFRSCNKKIYLMTFLFANVVRRASGSRKTKVKRAGEPGAAGEPLECHARPSETELDTGDSQYKNGSFPASGNANFLFKVHQNIVWIWPSSGAEFRALQLETWTMFLRTAKIKTFPSWSKQKGVIMKLTKTDRNLPSLFYSKKTFVSCQILNMYFFPSFCKSFYRNFVNISAA